MPGARSAAGRRARARSSAAAGRTCASRRCRRAEARQRQRLGLRDCVVLICSVPLPNRKIPYGSSVGKFVSSVATPQNCGMSAERVAHVEHEAAGGRADGAELDQLELAGEREREDACASRSISSVTCALTSISGSSVSPAAWRMIPPESSMKNDWACVMSANCCVDAALPLPAVSCHALAAKRRGDLAVSRLPR